MYLARRNYVLLFDAMGISTIRNWVMRLSRRRELQGEVPATSRVWSSGFNLSESLQKSRFTKPFSPHPRVKKALFLNLFADVSCGRQGTSEADIDQFFIKLDKCFKDFSNQRKTA